MTPEESDQRGWGWIAQGTPHPLGISSRTRPHVYSGSKRPRSSGRYSSQMFHTFSRCLRPRPRVPQVDSITPIWTNRQRIKSLLTQEIGPPLRRRRFSHFLVQCPRTESGCEAYPLDTSVVIISFSGTFRRGLCRKFS